VDADWVCENDVVQLPLNHPEYHRYVVDESRAEFVRKKVFSFKKIKYNLKLITDN